MKLLAARGGQDEAAAGCTQAASQTVAPLAKGKPVQTLPVMVQDQSCQVSSLAALKRQVAQSTPAEDRRP